MDNTYIKDFSYPNQDDPNFLYKIYKKREFYNYKIPKRDILKTYEEIKNYRDSNYKPDIKEARPHQSIIANILSPNTPYTGMLLMYGVGTGKTMAVIKIAEQFKEQVKKYNTKIFVLVPGPNTKENFKKELIESTNNIYFNDKNILNQLTEKELEYEKRIAINNASQYYKIMSFKSFHKKVLGEKIIEKQSIKGKTKSIYKKNIHGVLERDISSNKITNMDNTLLIVDEAHNITGNEWGDALKKIITSSHNLRIILLTATPMFNKADEIIQLLNFIRPKDDLILREKVFTIDKNHEMAVKDSGIKYLMSKAKGYVSYYRGSIPYTFADRIDMGEIPKSLLFTSVIKCHMSDFQYTTYLETLSIIDPLYKAATFTSNFAFPGLDKNKSLIGYYSTEGYNTILTQLNINGDILRKLINKNIFNNEISKNEEYKIMYENSKKGISGLILNIKYLKYFSIKFYTILNNLNNLVDEKSCTVFIYSNLVKGSGVELFAETLIQNGYLEYQNNYDNYDIKDDTIDYKTGLTFLKYKVKYDINKFKPAVFILITGSPDDTENLNDNKQKIIQRVFNNPNNSDGKYIKIIIGSHVMGEGITLKNCQEVHIIDVFYNIPRIEQVIGRVIRMYVHTDIITDTNKYPRVNVYQYSISIEDRNKNKLSSDELLFQKAELKYLTVKKIEHALKKVSIDCPLLLHNNIFPENVEKYKDCVYPTRENVDANKKICPALCDFESCEYKCDDKKLDLIWDSKLKTYRDLNQSEIDYNTFTYEYYKDEIIIIKNKIKDLYRFKYLFSYEELFKLINLTYETQYIKLFDNYLLDKALKNLTPVTENDFNNFSDILFDKYHNAGYLINRDKYYIFQRFNINENITMHYRKLHNIDLIKSVNVNDYLTYMNIDIVNKSNNQDDLIEYNYKDTLDYYNNREENDIIGIIDKNLNKIAYNSYDLFKIRTLREKILKKKRGTGIPTFKGGVCSTSKDKTELFNIIKSIEDVSKEDIKKIKKFTKEELCNYIKTRLLYLEKYSTIKDKNKKTYIMIPKNHNTYTFPYNLEDRINNIIKYINNIDSSILVSINKIKNKTANISYELTFPNNKNIKDIILPYEFKLNNNIWKLIID